MNPLSQLKRAIQTAVPEIMELDIGCQYTSPFSKTATIVGHQNKEQFAIRLSSGVMSVENKYNFGGQTMLILGRPIQLSDVLRAIDATVNSWNFEVFANGTMKYTLYGKQTTDESDSAPILSQNEARWNLSADLDGQDSGCINFLHDLLCKTND